MRYSKLEGILLAWEQMEIFSRLPCVRFAVTNDGLGNNQSYSSLGIMKQNKIVALDY